MTKLPAADVLNIDTLLVACYCDARLRRFERSEVRDGSAGFSCGAATCQPRVATR